jgi:hypothetical protein
MSEEENESSELVFETSADDEDESIIEFKDKINLILNEESNRKVKDLYSEYKNNELELRPDFQRKFVWDIKKSSRLIESALLDIPLPTIYLSEEEDDRYLVIDGQQRLTSFFSYIDGKFPDGRDFKLTGLKRFKSLNSLSFKDLENTDKNKIMRCILRTIIFRKGTDTDLKFEIFERLNIGAVSLKEQELRNCMFRGRYNDLLKKLADYPNFRYILSQEKPDLRMKDIQLVLRFFAFYNSTFFDYKSPMKQFLNKDMERYQNLPEDKLLELEVAFKQSVDIIKELLGKHAFRRFHVRSLNEPIGEWDSRINESLFDILMYYFPKYDKEAIIRRLDSIKEAYIFLMTNDDEFKGSITNSTSSEKAVRIRFDKWGQILDKIIGTEINDNSFSFQLKQNLRNNNPYCHVCGNRIELQHLDSAILDLGEEQFWLNRENIPNSTKLIHRSCDLERSKSALLVDSSTSKKALNCESNKDLICTSIDQISRPNIPKFLPFKAYKEEQLVDLGRWILSLNKNMNFEDFAKKINKEIGGSNLRKERRERSREIYNTLTQSQEE